MTAKYELGTDRNFNRPEELNKKKKRGINRFRRDTKQ